MATITGTAGADAILRHSISDGVVSDPPVSGTDNGDFNIIRAYGGNDLIEASDAGADIFGGDGNDRIFGGLGFDNLYGEAGSDTIVAGDNFGSSFWDIVDGGRGADRMSGGNGWHFYVVDDCRDRVLDTGAEEGDGEADAVITNLGYYALGENSGIDWLYFNPSLLGIDLHERASVGFGNSRNNYISGNDHRNILDGRAGDDTIDSYGGDDRLQGGAGDDAMTGGDGSDVLRGQDGDDAMVGELGRDILIGGGGADLFEFRVLFEMDVIRRGDGAAAFEGAGAAVGDRIFLPNRDEAGEFIDRDIVHFGDTDEGGVTFVERGGNTLVRFNVDDDPDLEFKALIEDGSVRADQYTFDDIWI